MYKILLAYKERYLKGGTEKSVNLSLLLGCMWACDFLFFLFCFNEGVGVTVFEGGGIVLAVNGETAKSKNTSNDCGINRC